MSDFLDYLDNFIKCAFILMLALIIFMIFYMSALLVDIYTTQVIGTETVKCIDLEGREFNNQFCEKEITCSFFGIKEDYKCSEVKNGS